MMVEVQNNSVQEVQNQPRTSNKREFKWHRRLFFPAMGAFFGLGIFLWAFIAYETMPVIPRFGLAPRNIMILAAPGFSLLMISIWFYFLSDFSIKTRLGIFLLSLVPIGGLATAVRKVDFDGDMGMIPRWRWEQANLDRVAEHRAQTTGKPDAMVAQAEITLRPEDMPQFRGRDFSGIITGPQLDISISIDHAPKPLWQAPIGEGYAQFAIQGPYAVTMEQRGTEELVTCYSTKDGHELWKYTTNALFSEAMGGTGPRSTPTIYNGKVYSLGAVGHAACLDLATGSKVWSKELLQQEGKQLANVTWGLSSSPLVLADKVIFNPGAPDGFGLVACSLETGDFIWQGTGYLKYHETPAMMNYSGYSTPSIVELAGKKQILHFQGKGLSGINLDNGQALWTFPFENGPGVNVCQPILLPEDQVLISSSYGNGSALVKIKCESETWSTEKVWQNFDTMRAKFSNNILHDGYAYGLDEGMLSCIDPKNGEETWKKKSRQRKYGHGQILLAGNHLLVMAEDGNLALVEANPEEFKEVWKFPALKEHGTKRVWNPPALVDGVAYIRDHTEMAAYKISAESAKQPVPTTNSNNLYQQIP